MNTTESPSTPDISRRRFIQTSSILAASAVFAPGAFAAGDETLKLALVGCGGRGTGAANQALSTDGQVKLVAMADVHKDRLDTSFDELKKHHPDKVDVAEENKFIGFDAYKKAIAMADVVILATPPGFRPMTFEEAVNQGKHIFTEKPVAVDAPGIRKVMAAAEIAKTKNLKIGVGLQRHHQAGYIDTIKRLQDGAIGEIVAARAYWNDAGVWVHPRAEVEQKLGRPPTEMEYQMRNWYYFVWICGDHIVEQHIHNLDVINWIKGGPPVRCWGMGGRQVTNGIDNGEIFDHHAVEFEYADGMRLSSECRHIRGCWSNVSEHVQGVKGRCDVSDYKIFGMEKQAKGAAGHHKDGGLKWHFEGKGKDPYQQEHNDLFYAIRNNQPYFEIDYGATSTMTAIMGRMATYSGKEIKWEEALASNISTMPAKLAWDADPPTKPDEHGWYPIPVPGKTITV